MQLLLDLFEPPPPRFDQFEPLGNEALVEALRRFAAGARVPGVTTPHLSLWGPTGSGKSHLLHAVAAAAEAAGFAVYYRPCGQEAAEPLPATSGQIVLLDDLEQASSAEQAYLFHAFNGAERLGQRWLVASTLPPAHLPLREDLRTRLALLPTFRVEPLGEEGITRLLQRRAEFLGVPLSSDAVHYLLRRSPRDIPTLLLVLEAATEESLRQGRSLTPALLRQVWQLLSKG